MEVDDALLHETHEDMDHESMNTNKKEEHVGSAKALETQEAIMYIRPPYNEHPNHAYSAFNNRDVFRVRAPKQSRGLSTLHIGPSN